ncbi:MAG: peptidoglycan editing factor PgeF [Spirochaetota bacterium]
MDNEIRFIRPVRSPVRVPVFTSMRTGGVSEGPYASLNTAYHVGDNEAHVAENRTRLFDAIGMPLARAVFLDQTHSASCVIADESHAGRGVRAHADAIPATDAVITKCTGIPLVIQTADCLPVVIADTEKGVIAAVHCGWKGIAGGILQNTVSAMRTAFGCRSADMHVFCSAAIGAACYEVGTEVASFFRCVTNVDGKLFLDIKSEAVSILMTLGVTESTIEVAPENTFTDAGLFSYRRDKICGRMATIVMIR